MADLLFRDVHLPGRSEGVDVAIRGETIEAIGASLEAGSARVVEGRGRLLTPAFVDAHFHLDSVLTGIPNASGTLREGIDNWGEYKGTTLTVDDVVRRASRYCEHAFRQGIMAIRSHVDVSDPELRTVEGLAEVRRRFPRSDRDPARRISAGRLVRIEGYARSAPAGARYGGGYRRRDPA